MTEGRESLREMKAFSAANQPEGEQAGPGVSTAGSDTAAEMIPRPGGRFMRNKDYFAATEPCMWRNFTSTDKEERAGGTSSMSCLPLFLP